jgi:hypothetical protein
MRLHPPLDEALRPDAERLARDAGDQLALPGTRAGAEENSRTILAVVLPLEASLRASQAALLARDLSGIEKGTRDQILLQKELAILSSTRRDLAETLPGGRSGRRPLTNGPLAAELREAQLRALHLGRVQAALLIRAQRSLRMLSHLVAGAQANYGPPPANYGRLPRTDGGLNQEGQ